MIWLYLIFGYILKVNIFLFYVYYYFFFLISRDVFIVTFSTFFDICYFQINKLYFGFLTFCFVLKFSRVPLCPGIPQWSEFRANFLITVLSQYAKYKVIMRKTAFSIIVNFIVTWSGVLLLGRSSIWIQ